jgi:hypothetical protein
MRVNEFIVEAKVPSVRDQIIADVKKDGGKPNEYFVRFTSVDRLGYSAKQPFARSPDIDDPNFSPDYIGSGKGRRALWFYPLSFYIKSKDAYATENPYVFLVRIKPNAWLQPVDVNTKQIEQAPQGKERVGLLRMSRLTPAAIFFKPAFDLVGKYYDYAGQHKRHGEVTGAPKPSFFDRVRGYK